MEKRIETLPDNFGSCVSLTKEPYFQRSCQCVLPSITSQPLMPKSNFLIVHTLPKKLPVVADPQKNQKRKLGNILTFRISETFVNLFSVFLIAVDKNGNTFKDSFLYYYTSTLPDPHPRGTAMISHPTMHLTTQLSLPVTIADSDIAKLVQIVVSACQ